MIKKVIIASESPVKNKAVRKAFNKVFNNIDFSFESIYAPSQVSDQPVSNDETYAGAVNRANFSFNKKPNCDFWVGIEGGIEKTFDKYEAFAWVFIKSKDKKGIARTASFFLPDKVAELIEQGLELGDADDIIFGLKKSKNKNGAVGILTNNIINRTEYYSDAIILALIPFVNEGLY